MTILKRRKRPATLSAEDRAREQRERQIRIAEEAEARRIIKRRTVVRRTLGWVITFLIVAALVVGYIVASDIAETNRMEIRAQLENTQFSHELDSTDPLLRRVDGSYYHLTVDKYGDEEYEYSTLDSTGAVVTAVVSTSKADGKLLWLTIYRPIDVSVKLIDPEDGSQEPRIEFEGCVASAVDPSQPSYTDDVHARVPGAELDDFDVEFDRRLCIDRVTLWVPDGTLQP